jgi:hypothetical protein
MKSTCKKLLQSFKVAAFAFIVAGSVSTIAAPINVASVNASSTFYSYNVNNLINGSGITGNYADGNWENKWLTDNTVTGTLLFDLGAVYDLSSTSIWNYGTGCCGNDRSVKDLGIEKSIDGISFTNIGNYVLNQPTTDSFLADIIGLNTAARYIRFDLNSNYGDDYTGLSEVQFNGAAVGVPEPATLALFALGLFGFVAARRRKQ